MGRLHNSHYLAKKYQICNLHIKTHISQRGVLEKKYYASFGLFCMIPIDKRYCLEVARTLIDAVKFVDNVFLHTPA